jgi:2-polyprenyl-3-methyl-5-hydroxy-6-metoxy-1,4-benzoquinol methylase
MSPGMESAVHYNTWVYSKLKKFIGKAILEVGIGYGNFFQFVTGYDKYVSIDIDEDVIKTAQNKNDNRTCLVMDAASSEFSKKLGGHSFDTVICINVLEHIPDHEAAYKNMINVLQPGGCLLLFVPAFNFLYNDMDKLAGHERRYVKKMCRELNKLTRTKIVKIEYFNPVGAAGWGLNKLFSHKDLGSSQIDKQVKLFDNFFIYFSKASNPVTKYFIGQSLICVFKKI